MPYYRGDYYRGDGGNYYKGDPFLGALVSGVAGKAIGRVGAAIGRGVARLTGSRATRTVVEQLPGVGVGVAVETVRRGLQPQLPALPALPGVAMVGPGARRKEPRYTKDGKLIRTMNPLNPKALRKALRRAEGFEKFAKRTVNALYKTVDGRRVRTFKKKKSR